MPYRYVPILKTKAGEAVALDNLLPQQKDRIFPLFCIGETAPGTFSARVATAWSGRVLALDGIFNFNFSGSTASFNSLFASLVAAGVLVVPSVELGAPQAYLTAVQAKVGSSTPGVVLRAPLGSVANAAQYAATCGWPTQIVDLVVQLGHIAEFDPGTLAGYVNGSLGGSVAPGVWRSVTLSSSAAPKDFGGLSAGVNIVPRRDWALWNNVAQPVGQPIDYSDYAQSHLDLTEPPGYAMAKATVSARYAGQQHWVMVKGRPTTGQNGLPMSSQYRSHAILLTARPEFGGVPNCWADARITAIANHTSTPGGRAQWVEIGTNRHLSVVVAQLP